MVGRKYDAFGNLQNWWTPEDEKSFLERGNKIISQFNKFKVFEKPVNGNLTETENIADLGGLSVSFAAFQEYVKSNGREALPVNGEFSQEQQFFISNALVWRAVYREKTAIEMLTDVHAPSKFRVDGPFSNMPEFYKAWNVTAQDKLFTPDTDRVVIWNI